MTSSLLWEPVVPPDADSLHTGTKFLLREMYGEPVQGDLDKDDVPFLRGAMLGTAQPDIKGDLKKLIAAIEKHGTIRLWEQY